MASLTIGGNKYDIPQVATFDMDESQILWDYAKLTIEDFAPDQDDGLMSEERLGEILDRVRNPGFLRTLMHVAYRRANPRASEARVKTIIGTENFADRYIEYLQAVDEDVDADPPSEESTSPPNSQSGNGLVGSNESSGIVSTNGSDQQDSLPEPTGTSESAMSSPESAPTT